MIQFIKFAWAFVLAIPDIVGIVRYILKIAKDYKEAEERRLFVKEVKDAIKESAQTYDNTRLINIFNPDSDPLPRRVSDAQSNGVRSEKDPSVH